MDPFTYPPAAPPAPTATRPRFLIPPRIVEATCTILIYVFVCTCAFLARRYVIDHGQLTPASASTLDAVLMYVLGIGLGVLASRLWVLLREDMRPLSDEEAQFHLARRSQ